MKKLMLISTMLVGAVALSGAAYADGDTKVAKKAVSKKASKSKSASSKAPASTAYAATAPKPGSGITVTVGGYIDFEAGWTSEDSAFKTAGTSFSRDFKFAEDTEVQIKVNGIADNGLKYGAVIALNADTSAEPDNRGAQADKTYIYVESSAGRVELGANAPVTTSQQVSAASIARATGGIDGHWYRWANVANVVNPGTGGYITSQELPAAEALEGGPREDANKISYYTPVFAGAQLGASYTPNEGDTGTTAALVSKTSGNMHDAFDVGLTYKNQFAGGVGVKASAVGEFASETTPGIKDDAAWALGLEADWKGFSLAGSFTDWGKSGLSTAATQTSQHAWTVGGAYETGPFGVSVTYLDSRGSGLTTNLDFQNLSVGADYKLAPGLVPYVDVSFFNTDDHIAATVDNSGSVVLVGAQLNF